MITITREIAERYSYRTARITCDVCGNATPDLCLPSPAQFYTESEEVSEIRPMVTPPAWRQIVNGRMLRDICPDCTAETA